MPDIAASAEIAIAEANASGLFFDGRHLAAVRGDSTCIDASAAVTAAQRLVQFDGIVALVGADCSGVTTAVVTNVSAPIGLPTISPSATAPGLSTVDSGGFFFRTAPSDARQGKVLADAVVARGIREIAITYTDNDYGLGLATSFSDAFEDLGGTITMIASHNDGSGDVSAEVGALAASGAKDLAVFGYVDQGGSRIIRASLDTGAFERFILADGMLSDGLAERFGMEIDGSFGTTPGSDDGFAGAFDVLAQAAGVTGTGPYRGEGYDAGALIVLAMQAAQSTERGVLAAEVLGVANAPGEKIHAGELARGLAILAEGGEVDYVGATDVEFASGGDAVGRYKEMEIANGVRILVGVR